MRLTEGDAAVFSYIWNCRALDILYFKENLHEELRASKGTYRKGEAAGFRSSFKSDVLFAYLTALGNHLPLMPGPSIPENKRTRRS
jgi:hypothetical protein